MKTGKGKGYLKTLMMSKSFCLKQSGIMSSLLNKATGEMSNALSSYQMQLSELKGLKRVAFKISVSLTT